MFFYRLGSAAILDNGGIVDKLVGDEVIGLFFGGVSGPRHAAAAIAAATDLVARAGRADATPMGPIPIGAGVHTGTAFVGPTGPEGLVDDFTALGDPSTPLLAWRPRRRPASCSSASMRPRRRARCRPTRNGGRSTCEGGRRRSTSWSLRPTA